MEEVPLAVEEAPDFLNRVQLEGEEYKELVGLEDLDRIINEVCPLLTQTPNETSLRAAFDSVSAMDGEELAEKVSSWGEVLRSLTRERTQLQDNIDVLTNYQGILENVAPALGGAGVTLGKGTRALVLTGNVKEAVSRLEQRFQDEIGPECTFHTNFVSRKRVVGLVSFPESKSDELGRILNQEGITPVDMRDEAHEGATIGEVITRIKATIEQHRASLVDLEGKTNVASAQSGAQLLAAKSVVSDALARLRIQGRFAQSEMVTVIHAWTPADSFGDLEKAIEAEFPGQAEVTCISHEDIPDGEIPTLLQNHKIFKPFELVLSLFQPPTYGTIDPTAMVAVSFIIFYGFILGDIAYGLVVLALALWIGRKWGHIEAIKSVSIIGTYMAVSSIAFGFAFGELLGGVGEEFFGLRPLWFHRAHETIQLMIYAIYIGIVHMLLSLVLGVREKLKHNHRVHAMEQAGLLMGLIALILFVFGYFNVSPFTAPLFTYLEIGLLGVGLVFIFKAMGLMGLMGVLEIMSLGGNVLSYARLMALGVAAIAIADIANDLPGSVGWLIGIPMAFAIHTFNIALSIASPTIHSLRLNVVEFLPKFYSPDGRNFSPFKKETQS
ncbi:MAG: hypothetical protein IID09_04170 [Candidatus Hydrogenedentes bacterium]|nr:hypothetical protein [Candidatus Hydrogenedentota bacterium]